MRDDIKTLGSLLSGSDNIVFFGGAGVSTESGIPDFRGVDGLYNQQHKYPPEKVLSHSFFVSNTKDFFDFYRSKLMIAGVLPNKTHERLAELERIGKLRAVITQNVDGLHQMAGSKNVLELHGSIHRNFCTDCGTSFSYDTVAGVDGVPMCPCGGVVKPDVVLYEEPLDESIVSKAVEHISQADMLIIGGTSLGVYPAAGLVNYYGGHKLVIINKSPTPADHNADLLINGSIGGVLGALEL